MPDTYAVPCPSCLAHIGEPCRSRRCPLGFSHLTRRRVAERRSRAHAQRQRSRSNGLMLDGRMSA